jgi:hypothetical protein
MREQTRSKSQNCSAAPVVLQSILEEIRLLRTEVSLLFPHEDLKGYAHPSRIKRSYEKALKQYPPLSV